MQSRKGDGDDEDNDLESAAAAERLMQAGWSGIFPAVVRNSVCCDIAAAFECVPLVSGVDAVAVALLVSCVALSPSMLMMMMMVMVVL